VPVSQEESGGVQGLRVWAKDAAERVKRLMPALGGGVLSSRHYDASVAELEQLYRLSEHDPELRGSVGVWLAGALTLRYGAVSGDPAARERAEPLLRAARDRGTALGASVTEEDRRWAAVFLLVLVSPVPPQQSPGAPPDLSAYLDWCTRMGPAGMIAHATEVRTLMAEAVELPLPPEFLARLRQSQEFMDAPTGPGLTGLLADMMPAGSPFADQLRQMMEGIFGAAGAQPPAPPPEPRPQPEPGPQPERGPQPRPEPQPTFTRDDFRNMVAAMDAVHATTEGLDDVLKSGDPRALNDLLGRLRSVQDLPLPGPDATSALESLRASLLNVSWSVGGNFQDWSAGRAHADAIVGHLAGIADSVPAGIDDPAVLGRAFALYGRIMGAGEAEDHETLQGLLEEAESLEKTVPEGHTFRFMADWVLGAAYGRLGALTRDRKLLLRSLSAIEKGMTGAEESGLPFGSELSLPYLPDFGTMRAALTGEQPAAVPDPVPPPPDASTDDLYTWALDLTMRYGLAPDQNPALLDTAIGALERVRDGVRQGQAPRIAAQALWGLAEAYFVRRLRTEDSEDTSALDTALESLTVLAADVLLQSGAEHGLMAARSGASRALRAARWALSYGRVHEAVTALELGRALVLQAASTSSVVPELLERAGRHDLAEAWRAASHGSGTDAGGGVPGMLPSTLRREALDALGYRQEGGLLGTPTLSDLADGVAEGGADVLVYLVPGEDEDPGAVIAVGPEIGVGVRPLPLLSGPESGPLERYLDATAAHQDRPRDAATTQAWEDSLDELCGWAFQVLGPVLASVEERLAAEGARDDRPLRAVLVPCGRLGIVPWHAARFPPDAPHDHLCRTTVVSYAASGGQFLRTVRRAPRDPAAAPVLVADPNMGLLHAEIEVMALRDSFYPEARLCGALYEADEDELVPGTPDDLLALLADGASLLHVASHGSAGTRPTVSAVHLADGAGLTVTRLLDREDARAAADGPLVVLSACETDLSTRDHDEALTLTTAFVAGGARDVVGSRWTAKDSASALLMAVFHHHLTVDRLSPVDALRAAQLWMLDPERENPGSLHGELLRQMRRPGLERIALWAPFIHQGHPGRARTTTEGRKA
jgi:hypothetical protein